MTEELTVQKPGGNALAINPGAVLAHMKSVQEMIKTSLTKDEDYMRLPGTSKDTLLQPGAEKLAFAAQLTPAPVVEEIDLGVGHREYKVSGDLVTAEGRPVGSGHASCSTMESKYRYRYVSAPCPTCGMVGSMIKGKEQYGGGWVCWSKKDGCGAKFDDTREFHTSKEENTDLADVWNTVLQMAVKRWLVSTVKRTLAVSGMFTMDLEDLPPQQDPPKPAETSSSARRQSKRKAPATSKARYPGDKGRGGKGQGNGPSNAGDGPPLDSYDDAAYQEGARDAQQQMPKQSKGGFTISPDKAGKISAICGELELDLDFTLRSPPCNYDGKLLQMPRVAGERILKYLEAKLEKANS